MSTPTVRISQLSAATPTANDVVPGSLASGSSSRKFTCGAIAALAPVTSVAGKTGVVTIGHTDVVDFDTRVVTIAGTAAPVTSVNGLTGAVTISGGGGGDVESVNGLTGAVSLTAATIGAAAATHGSQHAVTGSDPVPLVINTVTAMTQNENDYALGTADVVYITAATTDREIRGVTGGTTGAAVLVINSGATYSITVKHANSSAATSNRVLVPWEGDYVLSAKGGAALILYDTTESRWRVV
jgi:hypothetical protein